VTIVQALLLGAVQGATEFLPVSSSGHLAVLKDILAIGDIPILFDVILHIATLIVVVFVFRKRIGGLLRSVGRWISRRANETDSENLRLAWVIIVATVITAVIGLGVGRLEIGSNPRVVSALFIVTGGILIGSRFFAGSRDYRDIGLRDGLVVGIAQGLGVFPGISRSGITISAGLVSGLNREKAGEFAFLVSIPAILGAFILTLKDAGELSESVGTMALVVGFVAALIVGIAALTVLLKLVRSGKLFYFALYLIPLGIVGLFLL
jgi:undecaprenyl-diphosphatase